MDTSIKTNNSLSDYSTNTVSVGNAGIITTANVNNNITTTKINNDNVETETIDLNDETNYDGYFDTSTDFKRREFCQYVVEHFGSYSEKNFSEIREEEKAMLYEILKMNGLEEDFEDITSITSNLSGMTLTYKDGTTRIIQVKYIIEPDGQRYIDTYHQAYYINRDFDYDDIANIIIKLSIPIDTIKKVEKKDGKIILVDTNDRFYELDEQKHSLLDIKNSDGKSIYIETLRNYYDTSTNARAQQVFSEIRDNYSEFENVNIGDLTLKEQAMIYEALEYNYLEDHFDEIQSITSKKGGEYDHVFIITFKDGTVREIGTSYNNKNELSYIQGDYYNKSFTSEEVNKMINLPGIKKKYIDSIIDNGDTITINLIDGKSFELRSEDYSIIDVCDEHGNSIVEDIGMFTDDADKYGLYGGDQGNLLNNFDIYKDDPHIKEILNKYFPGEELTDEELKALFARMDHTGCPYIGATNTLYQMTENMSDEEFKETFGFERYRIEKTSDGSYVKTYNYNYMFLDFYLSFQKNRKSFKSLKDIIGTVTFNEDGYVNVSEDDGSEGTFTSSVEVYMKEYTQDMDINYTSSNPFGSFAISKEGNGNPVLSFLDYLLELYNPFNDLYIDNKIQSELDKGHIVIVGMDNFTMYSPEDLDGNGKLDDVVREHVDSHVMEVLGTTGDGGFIVSSWGNKYIVYPKAFSVWNLIDEAITGEPESLQEITVYDY